MSFLAYGHRSSVGNPCGGCQRVGFLGWLQRWHHPGTHLPDRARPDRWPGDPVLLRRRLGGNAGSGRRVRRPLRISLLSSVTPYQPSWLRARQLRDMAFMSGIGVVSETTRTLQPAAVAAAMPVGLSSMATQRFGGTPRRWAAFR